MATDSHIALESTSDIVAGFLETSIHSILFQRGVYPMEDFEKSRRFGVPVWMSSNPELNDYINEALQQVEVWLKRNQVKNLILVIISKETFDVIERWQFDVNVVDKLDNETPTKPSPAEDNASAAQRIRHIIRQIATSDSYLPTLGDATFNINVAVSEDANVPLAWNDTDPNLIPGGGEHVRLKSLSTDNHKIDAVVSYLVEDPY